MSNETTASHRSFIELGRESVNIRLTNNIAVKRTLPTVSGTRKGRKEKRERERVREREGENSPYIFAASAKLCTMLCTGLHRHRKLFRELVVISAICFAASCGK